MRSFQGQTCLDPVPARIVTLLRKIDLAAGAEGRHLDQLPQLLGSLRETARVESVTASNAIEGVVVDPSRAPSILAGHTEALRTRSEEEFAGYTKALDYVYSADPGGLTIGLILHLHRLTFSLTEGKGGTFKQEDNLVVNREPDGSRTVRFTPVSARDTPYFMEELITRTNDELADDRHHPLLVTTAFVLDLLCIHPFVDGNGRVARLATAYLLERNGYRVGRYVSIEQLTYDERDDYYAALRRSTEAWFDEGSHDPWPWAEFILERIAAAYHTFNGRVTAATAGGNKQDRVRDYVLHHSPATFSINDIRQALPGVSDNTIRLVLARLRDSDQVSVDGTGRGATWHRTRPPRASR